MSYISYKLYRMLRIPALIILGVEGLVLGCGMFNLGACFLAMLFGLVPFDIRYLMGPWLGTIFAFIFIFLVNKIPFTASLMYKQLRREYLMHNKKICLPEKEQEGFSILMRMEDDGQFRSRYISATLKKAFRVKKMSQEEWEKYYYDMMMEFLPRINDSSYAAVAQWCCLYAEKHDLNKPTSKKSSAKEHASYTQDIQERQMQEQFNQQIQQEQNRQQEQIFEETNARFNQDMQRQMQENTDNINRQMQDQFNQQMQQQLNNHMF